jgi:hypothetical protein
MRTKSFVAIALCGVMFVAMVFVAYRVGKADSQGIYDLGYFNGYQSCYNASKHTIFDQGFLAGNASGYRAGFQDGVHSIQNETG